METTTSKAFAMFTLTLATVLTRLVSSPTGRSVLWLTGSYHAAWLQLQLTRRLTEKQGVSVARSFEQVAPLFRQIGLTEKEVGLLVGVYDMTPRQMFENQPEMSAMALKLMRLTTEAPVIFEDAIGRKYNVHEAN